jgi:hypothetical protein
MLSRRRKNSAGTGKQKAEGVASSARLLHAVILSPLSAGRQAQRAKNLTADPSSLCFLRMTKSQCLKRGASGGRTPLELKRSFEYHHLLGRGQGELFYDYGAASAS